MAYASPRPVYPSRVPAPVRIPGSPASRSTTPLGGNFNPPEKLLYQLPPSPSLRSPPLVSKSAHFMSRSRSPPSADARRTSFGHQARPMPAGRHRPIDNTAAVPRSSSQHHGISVYSNDVHSEPKQVDLDAFAELCRKWYYDQHSPSGQQVSLAINTVAPAHRATYSRVQASVRSTFHIDQAIRRITDLRALLASTLPGNSLTPSTRANPSSSLAKKERIDRLSHFIQTHCLSGIPGTHPFFQGLYALLRLQSLPEKLGGAGDRVLEWELDDAVFLESAGKDFTLEAVAVLKGVLGFEEQLLSNTSRQRSDSAVDEASEDEDDGLLGYTHASTRLRQINASESLSPERKTRPLPPPVPSRKSQQHTASTESRSRATSDPFLDPSRSNASGLSQQPTALSSSASTPSESIVNVFESSIEESATHPASSISTNANRSQLAPTRPQIISRTPQSPSRQSTLDPQALLSEPQIRLWSFPPMYSNPEIHQYLKLFPVFITKKAFARFPPPSAPKKSKKTPALGEGEAAELTPRQLEEGVGAAGTPSAAPLGGSRAQTAVDAAQEGDGGVGVRVGTGKFVKSERRRAQNWRGSLWDRLMAWLRDIFG